MKTYDNNEECKNENRHDELCDDDSDDEEEELYHCDVKNENKRPINDKVKTSNESEELKEKEKELEDCDLLIDECV